ncbi:MAG: hypothetical protein K6F25_05645 [Bacteroidales bacterium]|nr:hypothetical protein [Bacteroidales bacterium]
MKAIRYIATIALMAGLLSCQREIAPAVSGEQIPDGFVEVTFTADYPEPVAVPTRAKMGEGATPDEFNLYLCLYGPGEGFVQNWIPATRVGDFRTNAGGYITGADYKALLPITDEKRTVHLFVNPPADADPTLSDYMDNVMEKMVDTDGECSYWQQVILPNGIKAQLVGGKMVVVDASVEPLKHVKLVRNFAKVIVTTPDPYLSDGMTLNPEYEGFTVKRWTLINVPSAGYVAPYTGNQDEATRFPKGYLNIADYMTGSALYRQLTGTEAGQDNYAGSIPGTATIIDTFPGDPDAAEAGVYVNRNESFYLYERPRPTSEQKQTTILAEIEFDPGHSVNPSATDPVTYWYKIELLDNNGAYVPIYRNIVYRMVIEGIEGPGAATAEDAFNGAYFGNISASLETASLNELSDGTSLIHVDEMDYTFMRGGTDELLMNGETPAQFYFIPFIDGNPDLGVPAGQAYTASEYGICEVKVELLEVEGYEPSVENFTVNGSGDGTISVTLYNAADQVKKSVLRISGTAEGGKAIYREININLMTRQSFSHGTDVTSIFEAPDDLTGVNKKVVVRLCLPEDLGASLFPIQVRFEARDNSLSATSADLPVATGKSVFDPGRNTYFFVKTIKYSDYRQLNTRTKKYEYHYDFDCVFYTNKTGDNSTWIDIRDLKGEEIFVHTQLPLGNPTPYEP